MARIAQRDCTVELRGLGSAPAFEVGGKHGNVVTKSSVASVHKGWRAVAVDGRRLAPTELGRALAAARQRGRYTVTFRIGEIDERELEEAEAMGAEAAAPARTRSKASNASEEAHKADSSTRAPVASVASETAKRRRAEEGEEAERQREAQQQAAAEQAAKAAEDAARKAAEEEARKAAEEAARKAAEEAVRQLERRSGLPPRSQTPDPQQALMQALARNSPPPEPPKKRGGPCDKCDGPHHEDDCPHFKGKKREEHKDAWDKYGSQGKASDASSGSGTVVIASARIVPQPGDGSCLFHSLAYGLGSGARPEELRASIADYISANPEAVVGGNPLKDWVLWDSGLDVQTYARGMRTGSRWGGALELAVCAQLRKVSVHVYERGSKGFARISTFGTGSRTVNVHYGGRVHYDALEV